MPMCATKRDFANAIAALPFQEMMAIAESLVEMNRQLDADTTLPTEFKRDTKTALGMAQTLTDWAEAELDV